MKVLVDVNRSPIWTDFLKINSVDAVHWSAIGVSEASDSEIIGYALRSHSIVLTQDLDFGAILSATGAARPSVLQIRAQRVHPSSLGAQVLAALRELEDELRKRVLVTIEPEQTRVRLRSGLNPR